MRPLHKGIIVKKLSKDQLGKIVMPDSVQDDWLRGKVISVGPAVEGDIKEGDVIIFPPPPPHLGDYPIIGDNGYLIISENMALAIEEPMFTDIKYLAEETENG
uniref:Putative chaperonin n=1 Tax=viral metagenome TaxID=1070528 RepID=A0A6H2A4N0_9ZZZZ